MKTSYISGYFEIFHAGHLRILSYARSISDHLVVGVYNYENMNLSTTLEQRIDEIKKYDLVDEVIVINGDEYDTLDQVKPDYILKSPEHRGKVSQLQKHCESFGAQIIFTSANIFGLMAQDQNIATSSPPIISFPIDYIKRHNISKYRINNVLQAFKGLKVFVLGDLIIDEYIHCHPLGMSQEDPTIVVSPQKKEKYLGGSGIVAAHIVGLGAYVDYASIVGADEEGSTAGELLDQYGVNYKLFVDGTRTTTLKQRYRAKGKTLLKVSNLNDHDVDSKICSKIFDYLKKNILDYNLIVLSDFNYGTLPTDFANKITSLAKSHNIPIVADSQASSQLSDISRFKNLSFLTPTEHEAQLALNDKKSNLVVLAEELAKEVNADKIVITLAENGILILNRLSGMKTDRIEAISHKSVDPAGAGDSFLAASSLALAADADIWECSLLGSFMAAYQVSRVGNLPVTIQELEDILNYLE